MKEKKDPYGKASSIVCPVITIVIIVLFILVILWCIGSCKAHSPLFPEWKGIKPAVDWVWKGNE